MKSQVMKSAWTIYRSSSISWSEALKQAWNMNFFDNLFGSEMMGSSYRNTRNSR
jgi:hypothetical protein